jgi:predicted amidohydrolase YtcJ
MLRYDFIKIFAGGVMEARTANVLPDNLGRPGESGAPLFSDAEPTALVIEADRLEFQIAFHCMGDAAVRQVLYPCDAARFARIGAGAWPGHGAGPSRGPAPSAGCDHPRCDMTCL